MRPASAACPTQTRAHQADRRGTPNPMIAEGARTSDTGIRHALAFGVSRSGRFLRHFLELGMNEDGHGRRVFDGVMSHVAGAGKVFANHRFGMPGRTATQHEDRLYPENWFPFGSAVTTDPISRKTECRRGRTDQLESVVLLTGNRGFESVSLQRRSLRTSVPTSFSRTDCGGSETEEDIAGLAYCGRRRWFCRSGGSPGATLILPHGTASGSVLVSAGIRGRPARAKRSIWCARSAPSP